jgi:hypothetical protein
MVAAARSLAAEEHGDDECRGDRGDDDRTDPGEHLKGGLHDRSLDPLSDGTGMKCLHF